MLPNTTSMFNKSSFSYDSWKVWQNRLEWSQCWTQNKHIKKQESKTVLKFWNFFIVLFQNKDHTLFRDNLQLELQKIVAQAESTHSICYLYTLWLQVCLHKENHRKYTQGCLNIHQSVFQIKNQWPVCYNHLQVDKRMANLYMPPTLTRGSWTR